jgi:phthiodiolone/phenolphthiodiolone dimycocerosates ketoreductase
VVNELDLAVVDATSYNYPPVDEVEMTRRLTEGGVRVWLADQTLSWFPDGLWIPELAPIAREWHQNAFWDVYSLGGYLAGVVPGSRFLFSLDAVRRGPDVLSQLMLTLHELTGGQAVFALGAGEVKQLAPFGYDAPKPLARLEESIRAIRELWSRDEPFTFEGKTMRLTNAHLGTRASDGTTPPIFVVGAGPKLIEIGARYADGVMTGGTPEMIEGTIAHVRATAESFDRDPDELVFWGGNQLGMVMTYDDEEQRERLAAAPITKFIAAAFGRLDAKAWVREGLHSPLGDDWHYAKDLISTEWPTERVQAVIADVPEEMVEKGVLWWTVDDVAEHFARAASLGVSMLSWMDWCAFADPTQRWDSTDRSVRAFQRAKELLAKRAPYSPR